jgi:RNA polymerase sigma factor for flagellar operon FliA
MRAIAALKPNYKAGCLGAQHREQLLLQQLPQVRCIAKHIHERLPNHVLLDDLIQAGILGLIEAIDRYDPGKNVQLHSYAKFRVRGAIFDSLREIDWGPRSLRREARSIESAHAELREELGRNASEQELADALDLELGNYHKLLRDIRGLELRSLSVETGSSHNTAELEVPGPASEEPFHCCAESEKRELLKNAMAALPKRERQVLWLYYFEELSMKEVGRALGVVESRVSQIHTAALMSLRSQLETAMSSTGV